MDSLCYCRKHSVSPGVPLAYAKRRHNQRIPIPFIYGELSGGMLSLPNSDSNLCSMRNPNLCTLCYSYPNLRALCNTNSNTVYTVPTIAGLFERCSAFLSGRVS